jgi:hypothetical protein
MMTSPSTVYSLSQSLSASTTQHKVRSKRPSISTQPTPQYSGHRRTTRPRSSSVIGSTSPTIDHRPSTGQPKHFAMNTSPQRRSLSQPPSPDHTTHRHNMMDESPLLTAPALNVRPVQIGITRAPMAVAPCPPHEQPLPHPTSSITSMVASPSSKLAIATMMVPDPTLSTPSVTLSPMDTPLSSSPSLTDNLTLTQTHTRVTFDPNQTIRFISPPPIISSLSPSPSSSPSSNPHSEPLHSPSPLLVTSATSLVTPTLATSLPSLPPSFSSSSMVVPISPVSNPTMNVSLPLFSPAPSLLASILTTPQFDAAATTTTIPLTTPATVEPTRPQQVIIAATPNPPLRMLNTTPLNNPSADAPSSVNSSTSSSSNRMRPHRPHPSIGMPPVKQSKPKKVKPHNNRHNKNDIIVVIDDNNNTRNNVEHKEGDSSASTPRSNESTQSAVEWSPLPKPPRFVGVLNDDSVISPSMIQPSTPTTTTVTTLATPATICPLHISNTSSSSTRRLSSATTLTSSIASATRSALRDITSSVVKRSSSSSSATTIPSLVINALPSSSSSSSSSNRQTGMKQKRSSRKHSNRSSSSSSNRANDDDGELSNDMRRLSLTPTSQSPIRKAARGSDDVVDLTIDAPSSPPSSTRRAMLPSSSSSARVLASHRNEQRESFGGPVMTFKDSQDSDSPASLRWIAYRDHDIKTSNVIPITSTKTRSSSSSSSLSSSSSRVTAAPPKRPSNSEKLLSVAEQQQLLSMMTHALPIRAHTRREVINQENVPPLNTSTTTHPSKTMAAPVSSSSRVRAVASKKETRSSILSSNAKGSGSDISGNARASLQLTSYIRAPPVVASPAVRNATGTTRQRGASVSAIVVT